MFFSTTSWCFSSFFSKFSTSLRSSVESRTSAWAFFQNWSLSFFYLGWRVVFFWSFLIFLASLNENFGGRRFWRKSLSEERILNEPSAAAASTFSSSGAFSASRAGSSGIVSLVPWVFFSSVSWTASSFSSSFAVLLTGTEASGSWAGALTLSSLISPSSGSFFSFGAALALLLFCGYFYSCHLSLYNTLLLLKRFPILKNQKNKSEKAAFFCESNFASVSK